MVVGPDWDARPNSSDGLGGTTVPTDEDGDKLADNLKRPAILNVKRVLDAGCDSLDANPGGGMAPKSELLTEGLGGKGKIWQSPLADNYRDEIRGIIECISTKVSDTAEEAQEDYDGEPLQVKETDKRAKWGK